MSKGYSCNNCGKFHGIEELCPFPIKQYGAIMRFEDAEIMVKAINETDYEPNDWEKNFVDSILKWRVDLSPKQTACLQKIYEKATS